MAIAPTQRLLHLDALRSFAILYGLLVHTATLGVGWPLTLVSDVSGYFRMGTFFLVSGFFAAMVLRRYGTSGFLKRRAIALLVPLACGLALLNPPTNWLIWNWHNEYMTFVDYIGQIWSGTLAPGKGPGVWHLHLWFLISLSFYALTAPAVAALVARIEDRAAQLGDRLAGLPGWLCVIVVAGGVAVISLGLRVGYEVAMEPFLQGPISRHFAWLVRNTLYYWPMFLVGMAVFHHAAFANRFQSFSLPGLILGLVAVLATRSFIPPDGLAWEVAQLLSRAFLTVVTIAALMAVFRRWQSGEGFLSRSAEAIYSIYILHFLVIYLIAHALRPLGLGEVATFFTVASLTFVAVFALHRIVIRPSALLSLMFNGKPWPGRTAGKSVPRP